MLRNRLQRQSLVFLVLMFVVVSVVSAELSDKDQETLWQANQIFIKVAKMVKPSVVNISTETTVRVPSSPFSFFDDFFRDFGIPSPPRQPEREMIQRSLGSGVIVSSDGYILTNNHVIKDADKIWVSLVDKRKFEAEIVGADPETDVAVLKIDAKDLPKIEIGDSDGVQEGEWVLAIGNPFGLGHTITAGIISARTRSISGLTKYGDFIQTDAAINPGNSGGALVNLKGELIGINTAITTNTGSYQGVGFAIPINFASQIMRTIIDEGKVVRGYLGVWFQEVNADLARKLKLDSPKGVIVDSIIEDSPADKAGLEKGDIILKYDGKEIENSGRLQTMVMSTPPGTKVKLDIIRDGKPKVIEVKIGEKPAEEAIVGTHKTDWLGITVQDMSPELAEKLGYKDIRGVVVVDVDPTGPAARKGIRRGDVIREIDNRKVTSVSEYRKILSSIDPKEGVLLWIQRGENSSYVAVYPSD